MATLQIYYKNGNYEEIIPTSMQFGEGYLLQNDYIELEDIENKGIVWERSFFACEGDDEEKKNAGLMVRKVLVLDPATLGGMQAVVLNGNNCVFGSLEEEEDEELEEIHERATAIKEGKMETYTIDEMLNETDAEEAITNNKEETHETVDSAIDTEKDKTTNEPNESPSEETPNEEKCD